MQWNLGGWLGGQIGGTAWILVASVLSFFKDFNTGLMLLAVFAVPNIAGFAMWRRRASLSCYKAMQMLLFVAAIAGLLAVYVLEKNNLWEAIQTGGTATVESVYVIIALVFAFLMAMFWLRFGRERDE